MALIFKLEGEYAFLNNKYKVKIIVDGKPYSSVDKAFRAYLKKKEDTSYTDKIDYMEFLLNLKFQPGVGNETSFQPGSQSDHLLTQLLATKNDKIIYSNVECDTFWGLCMCEKCIHRGSNYLGSLLMKIREENKTTTYLL